jgi:hypothetical protein
VLALDLVAAFQNLPRYHHLDLLETRRDLLIIKVK